MLYLLTAIICYVAGLLISRGEQEERLNALADHWRGLVRIESERAARLAAENARLQALIAETQALLAVHQQLHRQQVALAIARGQAGYVAPAVFLN
ncbi:MAG: hypothetical protein EHM35_00265 [Planctomycetaceae bacterium]|nr:MAG: hypothetical protein EHM35_00265 [Planctomycetaceae bacterium]